MKKETKFNDALTELQGIVQQMEADDVDIDTLTAHVKRAQELVDLCKKKLLKTETEVNKLTADAEKSTREVGL